MKKMITLLAAVMLVTSSFAQYHEHNQKDYDKNEGRDETYNDRNFNKNDDRNFKKDDRHRNDHDNYNTRERDMQIAQINREYDRKIESVQYRLFMNRSKKEAIICSLQNQRRDEIRMVYEKFSRNNRFDDRDHKRHW